MRSPETRCTSAPSRAKPVFEYSYPVPGAREKESPRESIRCSSSPLIPSCRSPHGLSSGNPAECESSWRTVMRGESRVGYRSRASSGRCFSAGSSSDSLPASRRRSTAVAVKLLVSDAMRKAVSRLAGCAWARSRAPHDFDQRTSPSTTSAATMPGGLRAANCSSKIASTSGRASDSLRERSWGSGNAGPGSPRSSVAAGVAAGIEVACGGGCLAPAQPARRSSEARRMGSQVMARIPGSRATKSDPVAAFSADPICEPLDPFAQRRARGVAEHLSRVRHVRAGERHVAHLRGLDVQVGADAERLLEETDQLAQAGRLRAAQVDDLVARQRDRQGRQYAGEDVLDVRVVAAGGAVAEEGELLSGEHAAGELVDGEVGPLARAVHGEEAQRDRLQAVQVAPGGDELLARRLRGRVRAERRVDPRALLEGRRRVGAVHAG